VNNLANFAQVLLIKGDVLSLSETHSMVKNVLRLKRGPAQNVAEALLYDCLCSELSSGSASAELGRLKGLLALGYPRDTWDFSEMFARVLPKVAADRQELYRALGAAILDERRVADLDAFELWRATPSMDPFEALG
jgi:hypothetical protein